MLPDFIRYFLRDFIEGAVIALLALTAFGDVQSAAHAALIAVGVSALAAARRNVGRFIAFLNATLNTEPDA